MADRIISFEVSVPTDNGFIGRSCKNASCGKYFKVMADDIRDNMYCPYCGQQFTREELWTPEQEAHFRRAAQEQAKALIYGEIDKMFGKLARQSRSNKNFRIEHRPIRYQAKRIVAGYEEKPVDSELLCSKCKFAFQVYGIFGYCPGCGSENLRIYDANLEIIKQEVHTSPNQHRALRHAYTDLVSTFESVAAGRARATGLPTDEINFQNLYETRKFFKKATQKDIFVGSDDREIRGLLRVFLKRHVYEHSGGIIGERYIRLMPEDKLLLGQKAELSIDEFEAAADTLRKVLDRIVDATT